MFMFSEFFTVFLALSIDGVCECVFHAVGGISVITDSDAVVVIINMYEWLVVCLYVTICFRFFLSCL